MIKAEKIYVVCPANSKTGGPELLHQLAHELTQTGHKAFIVYTGIYNHNYNIIDEYSKYIDSYLLPNEIEDNKGNVVIVPETNVLILKEYKHIQKAIWWLSVDNFYFTYKSLSAMRIWVESCGILRAIKNNSLKMKPILSMDSRMIREIPYHLCQSRYAMEECRRHGLNVLYLSDYLNASFLDDDAGCTRTMKQNIVAYNPKKGYRFTKRIIQSNPVIKFIPIKDMTRVQVRDLLNKTKVYIDFGNHPGMDRIPREARMQGCVVITGKNGAANYFEDVPIEEKFERKTKNIKPISELIKSVFLDYEYWDKKQSGYTTFIKGQRDRFSEDVRIIFG